MDSFNQENEDPSLPSSNLPGTIPPSKWSKLGASAARITAGLWLGGSSELCQCPPLWSACKIDKWPAPINWCSSPIPVTLTLHACDVHPFCLSPILCMGVCYWAGVSITNMSPSRFTGYLTQTFQTQSHCILTTNYITYCHTVKLFHSKNIGFGTIFLYYHYLLKNLQESRLTII
jgi:hypothetical protein